MGDKSREPEGKGRRRPLWVTGSDGTRQRFLRGMITHDLVQRGLGFDDAYAAASAIRDRLGGRDEVPTAEIRDLIAEQLHTMFGDAAGLIGPGASRTAPALWVIYHGDRQPFSRGLLARSIHAAGLDLDRAYALVTQLEGGLREERLTVLPSAEIARRVADLLELMEGGAVARRYRMVRSLQRLPRPLVIYVGGASGTGKSTLSLELAPLLRIYRINATDTIRQVMRMVFTPTILPSLHSSSFEIATDGVRPEKPPRDPNDPAFAQRLLAAYDEQATRVCVGVRAVVERAIAENMSIVVEGVHLHPDHIPFGDLEGAVFQIPLMLVTLNSEVHRTRFLARSRFGTRRAERYLEYFPSIRIIHDHLLQRAEAGEFPLLDTSDGDPPVANTLRVVTGLLEKKLPSFGRIEVADPAPSVPTLLLVIDGLADRPVRALGGRTPLEAARTPTLDQLAREGQTGLADPVGPGVVPDTASGSLALFGQSPLALHRGPVEALGAGLQLKAGDVALRGNFATVDKRGIVVDRRAGRIRERTEELAAAIDRLVLPGNHAKEVEIRVKIATEHRLAIVLCGDGLSSAIHGSDPGDGAAPGPPLTPRPLDPTDGAAVYTAGLLALFEQEARAVLTKHAVNRKRSDKGLPVANSLLTRGAGRSHRLLPLERAGRPMQLACVSGDRTLLGLASWLGAETITDERMTANLDTDLRVKFKAARQALAAYDLVVLHLKGADIAAHDKRPDLKVAFLERIDAELAAFRQKFTDPLRIAVSADHATLSESGQHSADPPPVLIWGAGIEADDVTVFHERAAGGGGLGRFPLQTLLSRLFELS